MTVYVLRDLGNGEGRKYIWWHTSSVKADQQHRRHAATPSRFSPLSAREDVAFAELSSDYEPIAGCLSPNYWKRKDGR